MYFPETKYFMTTEITTSTITVIEKQLKRSTQIFSQTQKTTQGPSLPYLDKPGTLKMGTASKNKNMGPNLGKGGLKDQLTWQLQLYKHNFSILPRKNFKADFNTIFPVMSSQMAAIPALSPWYHGP